MKDKEKLNLNEASYVFQEGGFPPIVSNVHLSRVVIAESANCEFAIWVRTNDYFQNVVHLLAELALVVAVAMSCQVKGELVVLSLCSQQIFLLDAWHHRGPELVLVHRGVVKSSAIVDGSIVFHSL